MIYLIGFGALILVNLASIYLVNRWFKEYEDENPEHP